MQEVTLTYVNRQTKEGAKGPYTRLLLKTQEYGEKYLSGFGNKSNDGWGEGQKVKIEVEKVVKDGKEYLNFSTPKQEAVVSGEVAEIRAAVQTMAENFKKLERIVYMHYDDETGASLDTAF